MGIRCYCPNGHRLNLKAFLAGRVGVCPHCEARFRIPMESEPKREGATSSESAGSETAFTPQASPAAPEPAAHEASSAAEGGSPQPAPDAAQPAAAEAVPQPASPDAVPASQGIGQGTGQAAANHAPDPAWAAPAPAQPASAPGPVSDPVAEAPHLVWYVRPPSGGEFGPAKGDIMQRWIEEGRVTPDSLVWREGWPQWQPARQAIPALSR